MASEIQPTPTETPDGSGSPDRGQDTRERLLDAAEDLFAERGFEGTSMRAITSAAASSLSAVNYHFGSKEGLLRATLMRRLEPVNRLRIERLDALEADGARPSLEAVLDAFLRPGFEMRSASVESRMRYRRVAARLYSDPPELVNAIKREMFSSIGARFMGALDRALPGHGPEAIALGWQFTVGVMVHVMAGHLESVPGTPLDLGELSDESLLQRMLDFVAAGMRATRPAAPAPEGGSA